MTAPLGDRARALVRWVERCGGRTSEDSAWAELVVRRGWYPEDWYGALAESEEAGAIRRDGGETLEVAR